MRDSLCGRLQMQEQTSWLFLIVLRRDEVEDEMKMRIVEDEKKEKEGVSSQ